MFFLLSLPFKITIVIFHAFLFPPFFLLSLSSRPTACFSSTWILSLALLLTVSPLTLLPPSPLRSIGGSIPIVFSYYSEFLAQEKRGEHLSWLCMFWMIGGIYASAMAWAIIPHYGEKNKQIARSGNHCLRQYVYKSLNTLSSSHGCLHMVGMESKNIYSRPCFITVFSVHLTSLHLKKSFIPQEQLLITLQITFVIQNM